MPPTQPDAGYDARTQWLEGQNEARLQAYAQQQAARQAVPLQASQPRNPYGWLAQRVGNVFSPAAYAAPVPQRPMTPAPPSLPSKEDLNQQMRLIEKVLGDVFDDHDYATPYDQQGSSKVVAKEIKDTTRIIKAALFNTRGDRFTPQELAALQRPNLSADQQRTLAIAGELNKIINQYGKKDDALATAKGIQVIANYNTRNGQLNKEGFKRDLAKFFIDQKLKARESDTIPSPVGLGAKALHNIGESPLAAALFGRERVGTYGWKDEFKEKGNSDINQAHHLAMFIIVGMERSTFFAELESKVLDGGILVEQIGKKNPVDLILSTKAILIGRQIEKDKIQAKDIYAYIKKEISD